MQESVFPKRMRVLSGSALKALAIFAMLVDHSAICFQPLLKTGLFTAFHIRFTPYVLLRGFGRIGFPIFCFLLAEGFRHTGSKPRYALICWFSPFFRSSPIISSTAEPCVTNGKTYFSPCSLAFWACGCWSVFARCRFAARFLCLLSAFVQSF